MPVDVSIIIPAYNEANRIARALKPTIEFLKQKNFTSEIIVVSDGSEDSTIRAAEACKDDYNYLTVIDYQQNRGKGYAIKTGMQAANGTYRLFMDADYAVPIEYLDIFLNKIKDGYDIVIGSREHKNSAIIKRQSFIRERLAKLFNVLQRIVLSLPIKDTQCGFKLFTASAAEKLFNTITLNCAYFDAELLYIAKLYNMKISESDIEWTHDNETRLPISFFRTFDLVYKLFKIRFSKRSYLKNKP